MTVLTICCLLVGGALAGSAPAFALSQRGHAFGFAFGSKGEGAGGLSRPSGVAVNEANGDIYVVDAGNSRIERFGARGEFLTAWGWGVSDGKGEYELCTSACGAGIAGEGEGQLDAPSAIAVDDSRNPEDPSRGDLYVLSDTAAASGVIEKFGANGERLGRLPLKTGSGVLGGVAVDSNGTVWVSELSSFEVVSFSDATSNVPLDTSFKLSVECEAPGFAVDAQAGAFYVGHQLEDLEAECPEAAPSPKAPSVIAKLDGAGEVLSFTLDQEDSSSVAVDLASTAASPLGEAAKGDVYVDNLTSVAVFAADGSLIQRFGSTKQLTQGSGLAISSSTGDVYVADAKSDKIDVFEPEGAGAPTVDSVSFADESPTSTRLQARIDPRGADTHYYFQYGSADCRAVAASCTDLPAPPGQDIGQGFGAQAGSVIAAGLQPGTSYFYRVVATNNCGNPEGGQTCTGEGSQTFGTFTTLPSPAVVLADDRSWEMVSPPEKDGTLIYPIGGSAENGGPMEGAIEASREGGAITYAVNSALGEGAQGNRALEATQLISTRSPVGWSTQDVVTPHYHADGLLPGTAQEYRAFSGDLSLSLLQPFGLHGTRLQEPPLVEGLESEERGLYLRHDASCQAMARTCYEPLVNGQDDTTAAQFGGELEFRGASPNLAHVVFSSNVALRSSLPSASGLYEWSAGKTPSEALSLVSVLPGNQQAAVEPEPTLGDHDPGVSNARNAVSSEGSRVFFSAVTGEKFAQVTRLYMRDTVKGQTIVLNAAQGVKELPAGEREKQEVHFRDASSDGSRVFFTDNFPLTAQSHLRPSEEGPADLYVCETAEGPEGPRCKLTDLTIDPNSNTGESADVIGTLPGASEDGSYVYFVANGALSEQARSQGAAPGRCARFTGSDKTAVAGATCNLYVEHFSQETGEWEAPRFIARLSQEDSPDWGITGALSPGWLTSRVSPDGRYLTFMSSEPLTGYDNVDQSEAAHGARDEEVYLYNAGDGRLVCASCDPSGTRPHGVLDRESSGEGKGLLVDRFGAWQESEAEEHGGERRPIDHWLAGSIPGWTPLSAYEAPYQSRYLSNEGRLFFNSPDSLVAHDRNGSEDVYEYEPSGVGTCTSSPGCVALISSGESDHESAFMDASETGGDVFFLTSQPLVSSDHDTAFDLYDARICSEASPCLKAPPGEAQPCEALPTCRPASPPVPTFSGPSGSATFSGPGNEAVSETQGPHKTGKPKPLTRAQRLAKALRSCRRQHKKNAKRKACERRAREIYGPRTQAHKAKRARRRAA